MSVKTGFGGRCWVTAGVWLAAVGYRITGFGFWLQRHGKRWCMPRWSLGQQGFLFYGDHLWESREPWRRLLLNEPCVYCGQAAETIDHIVPQSTGGASSPANLTPACASCNNQKGSMPLVLFLVHYPIGGRRVRSKLQERKLAALRFSGARRGPDAQPVGFNTPRWTSATKH